MEKYREYTAKVLRVVDGDTIKVNIDLGFGIHYEDKLRFLDFDAPETYRPRTREEKEAGEEVKDYLEHRIWVAKGMVTLRTYRRVYGKYGRILARIFIDGDDIIQEMIDLGMEKKNHY